MKSYEINGESREALGSKESKRLRNEGQIPCVIYGGENPMHFSASEGQFRNLVYTPDVFIVHVKIGDKTVKCVMQDIQFHPVTDKVLHVDFVEVTDGKPVTIAIPIATEGSSPGERLGGNLRMNYRKLTVRGEEGHLPERLNVDISTLEIGSSIRVRDLNYDNLELLDTPSDVVVAVKTSRKAMAAAAAADGEEGEEEAAPAEAES